MVDYLPDQETLSLWLVHYGSFALFALLAIGIILLPVPDETLMVLAGIFIYNGDLHLHTTLLAAYFGAICGISVSYLIGRTVGHHLLYKYGGWLGLTEPRLKEVHNWFEHYGKWTLFLGYFIPGVRHLTGIVAGSTELSFRSFALFAYSGAIVWASTFMSIGYFVGDYWYTIIEKIEITSDTLIFIIVITIILAFIVKNYFSSRKK